MAALYGFMFIWVMMAFLWWSLGVSRFIRGTSSFWILFLPRPARGGRGGGSYLIILRGGHSLRFQRFHYSIAVVCFWYECLWLSQASEVSNATRAK
jgi:hypothetical protein